MREVVTISVLEHDVGVELFAQLLRIAPGAEGRRGDFSLIEFDPCDPVVIAVEEVLRRADMKRWAGRKRKARQKEYNYFLDRLYDRADFEAVDLLRVWGTIGPNDMDKPLVGTTNVDGCATVWFVTVPPGDVLLTEPEHGLVIVADRARRLLEDSGLAGVTFEPLMLVDRDNRDHRLDWEQTVGERWWRLTSDIVMPPLSPTVELRDVDGGMLEDRSDFSRGVLMKESYYGQPELHFRRSEVEKLPPFDLARTFEPFGRYPESRRHELVASQRFRRFCEDHGLQTQWQPVRIDTM